ncbi:hypothetical protein FQN60_013586 [Etheostoma spectabile]|uniref:Uncharacterized protein n=1 Tax=Etheostoma spectabile TaxID=54343 RepID=A0A5J5CG27_9PERO|nr:hypothetical protein FQN60_013586 [Etheostoma spectabile]
MNRGMPPSNQETNSNCKSQIGKGCLSFPPLCHLNILRFNTQKHTLLWHVYTQPML